MRQRLFSSVFFADSALFSRTGMYFTNYYRKGQEVLFSKVHSIGIMGVEGYPVLVEADVSDGLPGFTMVGYLSSEVREAQERVRTAIKNSGFHLP